MPKSQFLDFSLFVDFSFIKKSVSILQVLQYYQLAEKFHQKGDILSGPCPIHGGESPTEFQVSLSKSSWNCIGRCKRGGNVIDFVSLKEGVSIREAALLIQHWFDFESDHTSQPPVADTARPPEKKNTTQAK